MAYWDAKVEAQNSGEFDADAFTDVARGPVVDRLAALVRSYSEDDLVLTGSPEFADHEASISGDTAQVTVCMNADDWGPEGLEKERRGFGPVGAELQRVDDQWLVTRELDVDGIGRVCE